MTDRPWWPAALWACALLLGASSALTGMSALQAELPPVVLGDVVLADLWLAPMAVQGLLAVALLVRSHLARRRIERSGVLAPRRIPTKALVWALTAVIASGSVALCGTVGLLGASSGAYLLSPASPAGARVLEVDRSKLLLGSGDLYVLPPGSVVAKKRASHLFDDGVDPVRTGDYVLIWDGEVAHLSLWGTSANPSSYTGAIRY